MSYQIFIWICHCKPIHHIFHDPFIAPTILRSSSSEQTTPITLIAVQTITCLREKKYGTAPAFNFKTLQLGRKRHPLKENNTKVITLIYESYSLCFLFTELIFIFLFESVRKRNDGLGRIPYAAFLSSLEWVLWFFGRWIGFNRMKWQPTCIVWFGIFISYPTFEGFELESHFCFWYLYKKVSPGWKEIVEEKLQMFLWSCT